MRGKALAFFAAVALAGCLAPQRYSDYKSFQLVYHSDTRGFYNPCG